jgi:carbonic anhydrase
MKSLYLISSMTSLAVAFCSHGTTLFPRDGPDPVTTFGYDGLAGPLGWFGLNTTENSACALGNHQSPIDIVADSYAQSSADGLNFTFDDYPDGAEIENMGTTLVIFVNGSMTSETGQQFKLRQFHFHTPSGGPLRFPGKR